MNQDKINTLRELLDTGRAHDVHADDIYALLDAADPSQSHRRVIEKASAEIERLTRELAEERHLATVRGEMLTRVEAERDAARQERDALMPSEDERVSISVCMSEVIGSDIPDNDYVAVCRWLSRLSPPSATAQDRAPDAERTQLEVDDD